MRKNNRKISKYDPVRNGNPIKNEIVQPIKKVKDINRLRNYWLKGNHKTGRRDWTIFALGVASGLRASDLVRLTWTQVFDDHDNPRDRIFNERDKKTGKVNHYLYIGDAHDDLVLYKDWVKQRLNKPYYLFPRMTKPKYHITPHTLYMMMRGAGDHLGMNHLGSHTMRKTFGYFAYKKTGNIVYVMKRLNQSKPQVTLAYIGMTAESINNTSKNLDLPI